MVEFLSGKKTQIIAWLMVLVAIVGLITGDVTLDTFLASPDLHLALEGLGLSFLRSGVAKKG